MAKFDVSDNVKKAEDNFSFIEWVIQLPFQRAQVYAVILTHIEKVNNQFSI